MNSRALALAVILLLGTTLSEVSARSIDKRHVRRDWLIIPDAIAYGIYSVVNNISREAGEYLAGIAQNQVLLDVRNYLIEKTAALSRSFEELQKEIHEQLKKMKKDLEKEKRKQEKGKEENETPEVAQEN